MANTVEKFGLDVAVAPLPEHGPCEFRRLAQTFNRMQQRIAQLLNERSHMLMAVGHDLRTPLTRLKLRIELDDTLATRQDLLCELYLMQRMINGALSFLDNRRITEATEDVDLGSLVESICIGFADSGKDVVYTGTYGLNCSCQPTAITRAVNNLIENGCRYGTHVVADVRRQDQHVIIDIRDDGPGIPAKMREIVMQPFARLDPARASDGGLGLGLSIVRDVVRRHGAELILMDAEPKGLLVRIRLPLMAK
jgi:signal transduction histidine kinase